jgi:dinuclear metal center YbgI/SA1388 family protein
MQISTILSHLESIAPPVYQEHYDNAGLLTGNAGVECTGVLTTLDTTEAVVEEAISRHCNLIVSHHPIIFGGLKKISGEDYVGKAVIAAIRSDMAIYAIHTNLDNVLHGVNGRMAEQLGLVNCRPLQMRASGLQKLYCFVPVSYLDKVRDAIFLAGAGHIGHYSECSFANGGKGTFRGDEGTKPFVGKPGIRHEENEIRVETILPDTISKQVIAAMIAVHPYEEPAYDIVALANMHPGVGSGLIGELPDKVGGIDLTGGAEGRNGSNGMDERAFLGKLKKVFQLPVIRHTPLRGRPVRLCALSGGAGSFLISKALEAGADFYVTSDIKYHEFFDANGRMVIADIGHFESEQFTIDLLFDVLSEKFPNFAVLKSATITNPVNYYF